MPNGIPVATVALNAAKNAGILATKILGIADQEIAKKVTLFQKDLKNKVLDTTKDFNNLGFKFQANTFSEE